MRPKNQLPVFILTLFFLFINFNVNARSNTAVPDTLLGDSEYYLELRGKILEWKGEQRDEDKQSLDSAEINVINQAGIVCLTGLSDDKGRLVFRLPLNRSFTVSITKSGFVKKLIRVETYVPKEDVNVYTFTFNVDIFEKIEKLDVTVLDRPISRIRYRPLNKSFDYDKEYTAKVNGDLQKMYNEYYSLKRAEKRQKAAELEAARRDSIRNASKPAADTTVPKQTAPKTENKQAAPAAKPKAILSETYERSKLSVYTA
ncbi:MAG: hypothetical protein ACRC3B_09915 [Bacteroidia bacterium]